MKQSEIKNQYFPLVLAPIFGQFCKESEQQLERRALVRQLRAKNLLKTNSNEYYRLKNDSARYYYVLLPINLGAPEAVSDIERIVAQANLTGEVDEHYSDEEELSEDILPF